MVGQSSMSTRNANKNSHITYNISEIHTSLCRELRLIGAVAVSTIKNSSCSSNTKGSYRFPRPARLTFASVFQDVSCIFQRK